MEKERENIEEINNRIKAIKASQQKKYGKSNFSDLGLAFQVPIELVSGVIVGAGIGYILDKLFDFKFLFLVVFTIFGGISGLVNVARSLKKIEDEKEE